MRKAYFLAVAVGGSMIAAGASAAPAGAPAAPRAVAAKQAVPEAAPAAAQAGEVDEALPPPATPETKKKRRGFFAFPLLGGLAALGGATAVVATAGNGSAPFSP